MTKKELPILLGEIELEIGRLQEVVGELQSLEASHDDNPPDKIRRMAAAGFLHNLYNGMENCLLRIARGVDEHVPSGPEAHRELLDQMASDVKGIRPPVIGSSLHAALDEYRRFRHAFRHMYFFDLEWERMAPLMEKAGSTCSQFEQSVRKMFSALSD